MYVMKNLKIMFAALSAALLMASCEEKVEDPAKALLDKARSEYDAGHYNNARMIIDSLSAEYPKAYKTRREAEILRRDAMIKEKERDLAYLDSVCIGLEAQLKEMVKGYKFNKKDRYQDAGYYTATSQDLSKNASNSFLRASVNEDGTAYIASFYRGSKIGYNTVKVTAGESFVQCDKPFTSSSYRSAGVINERCDYKYGEDGGLMDFIAMTKGPFKVELLGGNRPHSYTLRDSDAAAIQSIVNLSKFITDLNRMREMRDDAAVSLKILLKNKEISEENAAKEAAAKQLKADSVSAGK